MPNAQRPCSLAFVLGAALALALAASPAAAQEVPISEGARTHFSAGVRLLQDPGGARYEEAYQEFKVAYADSPSPRILGNMGLCAMKLERDEEAIRAFERYLSDAPKVDPAERKQIESDLRTLRASLVKVVLTLGTPDVRVIDVRIPVQGSPVTNSYGPVPAGAFQLGVHPGHHVFTIKREGYAPRTWEVDGLPSSTLAQLVALEPQSRPAGPAVAPPPVAPLVPVAPPVLPTPPVLASPPDPYRPTPRGVWALAGISIAAGVAGIVTGAVAVVKHSDYESINNGTRIPDAESLQSSGTRLNNATDVLLGTAIVGAVATIIVYATRPSVAAAPSTTGATRGGPGNGRVTLAPKGVALSF